MTTAATPIAHVPPARPSQPSARPAEPVGLDLAALKTRQQSTWASGDYARIAAPLQVVAENLCESVDLRARSRVLDVASGSGNTAIAAARRWCDVVALDYVPGLLDHARARAEAERLPIETRVGDAEALPFGEAAFDAVLSTFGVMFSPDQPRAAAELVRVTRSGGTIGLASWTPTGFIGELLRTVAGYVPPPAGLEPPTRWGTEAGVAELFGAAVTDLEVQTRTFAFRYPSPAAWIAAFRDWYGPVHRAFATLDECGRGRLAEDLERLLERWNCATDGTLVAPATYLEVAAKRR